MEIFMDKDTMELLTVATEYCAFIEKTSKFERPAYISKLHKILSLVYLKMSLLEKEGVGGEPDEPAEAFLSEYEYEYIKSIVSRKLGSFDAYINIYNSASNDSAYEQAELSDCVADIYHNLKNFVENCRTASEESALASFKELVYDFREYWGYRVLSVLASLHAIVYSPMLQQDDEDEDYANNYQSNSLIDNFMESYRNKEE